jgi:hypothetical protein
MWRQLKFVASMRWNLFYPYIDLVLYISFLSIERYLDTYSSLAEYIHRYANLHKSDEVLPVVRVPVGMFYPVSFDRWMCNYDFAKHSLTM